MQAKNSGKVTHQAIADALGVSRTLVTHALHGTRSSLINKETQQRILEVAYSMGYQVQARTTHCIGYVMPLHELCGESDTQFLLHVEAELRTRGYRLMLVNWDGENVDELSKALNPKTVDGVILADWYDGAARRGLVRELPLVVASEQEGVSHEVDVVAVDLEGTLSNILRHLVSHGHERIGLITSQVEWDYFRHIREAMQKAIRRVGHPIDNYSLLTSQANSQDIGAVLRKTMKRSDAPTAFILSDLWRALPALWAFHGAGYEVPKDVSLIAIFDSPQFLRISPYLSATDAVGTELAVRVVERLLQRIEAPGVLPQHIAVAGQVIERDSVGAPAPGKSRQPRGLGI
jgi:DNA-binding LacI/PurR family transcriptional regulator